MRTITAMTPELLLPTLDMVEAVFTAHDSPEEGRMVRSLVEEIRRKEYYVPELELVMLEDGAPVGYVMFSRFHIGGKHDHRLLLLSPAAVRTDLQHQHIGRDLIEHGFRRAREMGFTAVMVEGDPRNYRARGFETSASHGIVAAQSVHLPHPDCLMVKELVPGGLEGIVGEVEYGMYETLRDGDN